MFTYVSDYTLKHGPGCSREQRGLDGTEFETQNLRFVFILAINHPYARQNAASIEAVAHSWYLFDATKGPVMTV